MAFVDLPLHESEAIAAAAYDRAWAILLIEYKSQGSTDGGTYHYLNVPPEMVDDFLIAESHGQFVNWHIKPHYQVRRVS